MRYQKHIWLVAGMTFLALLAALSCGGDDDDDDAAADDDSAAPDDDVADDDSSADDDDVDDDDDFDDDTGDDDTTADDDDDDTVTPNPNARADAFRLFYRERSLRVITALNRFALSGDVVAANAFGKFAIARDGDAWEVVAGPEGNNPFGKSLFATWRLYQAIGGREFELSLIRMFEGIVFNEAVSGHPGLTTREAFPGWTRTMDGVGDEIERTKWGSPVTPPVTYDNALEQEILDTFYDGLLFTYRENPEEFLFNLKPTDELTTFSLTYVFDELDHDPPFLRVSDCCSSFMVSQKGPWTGAYWGNDNSRDNFTDYAMGFLTAIEAEATDGLPADVAAAAHHAAEAAHRIGDNIVAHDNVLMTVDEWHDYETLTIAGTKNPDGQEEWQDPGSLASCQMAYLAMAISTDGLPYPPPVVPLPGSIETTAIQYLFDLIGLPLPAPRPRMQNLRRCVPRRGMARHSRLRTVRRAVVRGRRTRRSARPGPLGGYLRIGPRRLLRASTRRRGPRLLRAHRRRRRDVRRRARHARQSPRSAAGSDPSRLRADRRPRVDRRGSRGARQRQDADVYRRA
ncbi:MAG: hypothetical protein M5R36_04275 [Deltaproteobacteria bacterium]|nr:hypothetical protein [Deltaproteobacteria bacterium]